ncbi:MAG TPA: hypothetical protein ENO11_05995, partial [Desulfobacteraceae bacterium]|nr:hypothetical protein [Desulfobacteraceae bacterium]
HKLTQKEENLPFLGHEGCKTCHPRQTAFWQATNHSKAWETLKKRNQARNLECLPCHVITSRELALSRDQLLSLPNPCLTDIKKYLALSICYAIKKNAVALHLKI